jgi:predicted nuclease of predicted toxin-antitoxin system
MLSRLGRESPLVRPIAPHSGADSAIWEFARDHDFVVVSKDNDFCKLSFLHGATPKLIWLSVGNAITETIFWCLANRFSLIQAFVQNPEESLLILTAPNEP